MQTALLWKPLSTWQINGWGHATVVVDDTDSAVMLVHHWQRNMSDVYLFQERWNKAWSIKDGSSKSENIKQHLHCPRMV